MDVIHAVGAVQVTIDLYAAAGEALAPIDAMAPIGRGALDTMTRDFAKARTSVIRNGMRFAISSEMWSCRGPEKKRG